MGISTPFFKAFGPLLFGRKPGSKLREIKLVESLGELYEVFGDMVPEKLLEGAERGVNSRERSLPPRVTFWAFVWKVMQPQSSCREVVRKVETWWRWTRPQQCPPGCDKETFETLPANLAVCLIGMRVQTPGFRSRSITLVTTLIDPDLYPADELRELYAKHWNVELHFHQIKIALGMDVLRCQSP